jgi:hypothetical protein
MVKREGGHPVGHKPEWWGGISLGNIITIAGGIVVAAVGWGAITTTQEQQAKEIAAVEQRGKEHVEQLRADMRRVEDKLDKLLIAVREAR